MRFSALKYSFRASSSWPRVSGGGAARHRDEPPSAGTPRHRAATAVHPDLLRDRGAVNEEVLKQLASGALQHSPASLSVAVSGALGPEEDEGGNPIGWFISAA